MSMELIKIDISIFYVFLYVPCVVELGDEEKYKPDFTASGDI